MKDERSRAERLRTCVIFGGTGCIGTHVALHFLQHPDVEKVYLADIRPLQQDHYLQPLLAAMEQGRVRYLPCDVRQPLERRDLPEHCDLIVNLAAIHREPGHTAREYYETNLRGAEHVCAYAARAGCHRIIFTSSIAPYGPSDAIRNEDSLPVPETPYGGSKLVAEQMHIAWQQAAAGRKLVILRPGVVFGAGEHANVARLVQSLARGYFFYMGNRDTRKAGVYVKELCQVMEFAMEQEGKSDSMLLWNVSMDPPPKLSEYVDAICRVSGYKQPRISLPRQLLLAGAHLVAGISTILGVRNAINPVRVKKVSQPTFIDPARLRAAGYRFRYTLEQAMSDWKSDAPDDFRA
ncbi:MAG TPA: NAD(P)-dependent oxidoreductase [Acidobacteriaceae bacterium]|nr:NAD(P)-dependent oxidoreductase [Acidobacteriaceae bacterium]